MLECLLQAQLLCTSSSACSQGYWEQETMAQVPRLLPLTREAWLDFLVHDLSLVQPWKLQEFGGVNQEMEDLSFSPCRSAFDRNKQNSFIEEIKTLPYVIRLNNLTRKNETKYAMITLVNRALEENRRFAHGLPRRFIKHLTTEKLLSYFTLTSQNFLLKERETKM